MKTFAVFKCNKTGNVIAKVVKALLKVPASYVRARNAEMAIQLARI